MSYRNAEEADHAFYYLVEQWRTPPDVAGMVVAHKLARKVLAALRRGDADTANTMLAVIKAETAAT
jgi:hypothetical protein